MKESPTEARSLPHPANGHGIKSVRPYPALLNASEDPDGALDLDAIALSQALIDFEVANARVLDLTQRLLESNESRVGAIQELEVAKKRLIGLQAQYDALAAERDSLAEKHRLLNDEYHRLLSTKAYRVVRGIWSIRRVVKR